MTQKIARLSEVTINQIAAGEVVENPASIIKELIENSLDAGSKNIKVAIRGGGGMSIEIEDDGCGMGPQDAVLSLERHATSKIRNVDDLSSLVTMGFRGEALAAIASVSQFEMKTSDGNIGTYIKASGGVIEKIEPCARNPGTTISVKSLFFNVPARLKFQKSVGANTAQVTRVVEIMSMANPEVAFSYFSQDQKIHGLPIASRRERIEAILGPFKHRAEEKNLWGLFSDPEGSKSHRRGQFLFINRRPVFSPLIAKAVQTGYGTRLKEHMYPPFVLFMEVDPALVDVNVHPQKKEVRLSNESALFSDVDRFVASMFTSKYESNFSSPLTFEAPPSFVFSEPRAFSCPHLEESLPFEILERPLFVLGKYLLMEKDGLFLVDLQGARARVFFEERTKGTGENQSLLWPIELTEDDPEAVSALQKMGIESRWVGEKKLAIDSLPSMMERDEFVSFFEALKDGYLLDRAAVSFCRASNKRYSFEEALHLWRRLQLCQDRLYDPIGKKIWTKIEQRDLEKCLYQESIN